MAKYDSSQVGFMLLGGYSMLGAVSKIEDTVELKLSETPVLGTADEDYFSSGARKTTVTQDGWFDDATNSIHEALKSLPSTALPLSIAPHGNVGGRKFDGYRSVQRVGYTVQLSVGEVHKANGEYGIWYGKQQGIIIAPLVARGAAGSTDNDDVLITAGVNPAGTNGGAVYLHMTALSGCASCTVTFRHSSDGSTYTDKQAFTAVPVADVPAGALAGQYIALTGTINKYGSVAWVYASATSPSATFMCGVYVAP